MRPNLSIQQLGTRLVELLAPRCCAVCAARLPFPQELFCGECQAAETGTSIVTALSEFPVAAVARYQPPWSMAIRNFKYADRSDLAAPLARAVWTGVKPLLSAPVVFIPVPLHPKRLCERGYNQSALLAHRLARLASSTVDVSTLRRVNDTAQQARLNREHREQNLQHTMQAAPWRDARPVVLVDDVFTTGATLLECERALSAAGARVVGACVIAIAGRDPNDTPHEPGHAVQPEPLLGIL